MDRYEATKIGDSSDSKCNSVYDSGCIDSGFHSGVNLSSEQFESEEIRSSSYDLSSDLSSRSKDVSDSKVYQQQDSGLDLDHFSSALIIDNDLDTPTSKCSDQGVFASNVPTVSAWEYFKQDEDGDTCLHMAVIQRYLTEVDALCRVAQPEWLDIANIDLQTALHLAVCTRQADVARRLVSSGASVSLQDLEGNTPLHLASMNGDVDCLKALLEQRAASAASGLLDRPNYDGMMCVHLAACKGHVEALQYLMRSGANMNAREMKGGRTVLHLAIEYQQSQGSREGVLQLLLEEGLTLLQLDATTYAGHTAYQLAECTSGADGILAKWLVNRGAQRRPFPADDDEDLDEDSDEMYPICHGTYFPQLTLNGGPINASA